MPARSSAPASRRSAAGRCTTRQHARTAVTRPPPVGALASTAPGRCLVYDSAAIARRRRPRQEARGHRPGAHRGRRRRGQDLARALSAGRARRRSTSTSTRRCATCSTRASRKFAARPAFTCMGKSITFAELDTLSTAFGALAAGEGLPQGHARRADDAQHPAVSGRACSAACAPAARWSTSIRSTRRASSSTSSTIPAPR